MAYCRSCGAAVDTTRDFCTGCGVRVETGAAAAETDTAVHVEVEQTLGSAAPSSLPQPEESITDRIPDPAARTGRARRLAPRRAAWLGLAMFIAVGIGGGLLAARLLNQRDTSGQAGAQADSTVTSRSTPDPTIQPTSSSQSPSDFSDIHEQASQLSGLLARSGEARSSVVDAVDAVASCTNVSAGANALAAAADSRQDSLNQLDSLETDVLPDGRALVVTLRTALRLSLEADQHFAAWARSVLHGGCSGSAPRNRHYWAAIEASRGATVAKHHFVRIWNPIATAEGLPAVEETDI